MDSGKKESSWVPELLKENGIKAEASLGSCPHWIFDKNNIKKKIWDLASKEISIVPKIQDKTEAYSFLAVGNVKLQGKVVIKIGSLDLLFPLPPFPFPLFHFPSTLSSPLHKRRLQLWNSHVSSHPRWAHELFPSFALSEGSALCWQVHWGIFSEGEKWEMAWQGLRPPRCCEHCQENLGLCGPLVSFAWLLLCPELPWFLKQLVGIPSCTPASGTFPPPKKILL